MSTQRPCTTLFLLGRFLFRLEMAQWNPRRGGVPSVLLVGDSITRSGAFKKPFFRIWAYVA